MQGGYVVSTSKNAKRPAAEGSGGILGPYLANGAAGLLLRLRRDQRL